MGFDILCCWGLIMWRMANWPVSDGKIWCESQMLVGYSPTIPSSWHWPVDLLKVETILRSWVFYSCLFWCLSFECYISDNFFCICALTWELRGRVNESCSRSGIHKCLAACIWIEYACFDLVSRRVCLFSLYFQTSIGFAKLDNN